jgi:hypothetical protein
MNDKDKEAFEKWLNKERRIFEANEPATFCDSDEFCMKKGWQAACEYKDAEIKKLIEGCCCSAEEQYTCIKCKWESK